MLKSNRFHEQIDNKYTFEKQKDKIDESGLVGDRWQEEKKTQELWVIF